MSDTPTELWLARLRAEVPFPQPAYGGAEAPANVREMQARLRDATAEVLAAVARTTAGQSLDDSDEPDWFAALADRLVPAASWLVGVGVEGAAEVPEKIREVAERVQKVPMLKGVLGNLGELVASFPQLFEQNTQRLAQTQASYFLLVRAHLEAVLAPLAGEGGWWRCGLSFRRWGSGWPSSCRRRSRARRRGARWGACCAPRCGCGW